MRRAFAALAAAFATLAFVGNLRLVVTRAGAASSTHGSACSI